MLASGARLHHLGDGEHAHEDKRQREAPHAAGVADVLVVAVHLAQPAQAFTLAPCKSRSDRRLGKAVVPRYHDLHDIRRATSTGHKIR